jgi:SAM-dependent methyltransferase
MDMKSRTIMNSSLPAFWEHFSSRHKEIEDKVEIRSGSYQGLLEEALYTSDLDLLSLFESPFVQGTFCDLGCGTGKTALLYGSLYPKRKAIGIEFEAARLVVGETFKQQFSLNNVTLIHADLTTVDLPKAETYFLYFPTGPVLDRILSLLYQMAHHFNLCVIESHGDLIPRIELENWLSLLSEIPLASPRHYPFIKIYQKKSLIRDESLLPFNLTFQEKYLLISDQTEEWIGESLGMEWTEADRFELLTPPRTISWKSVKKLMDRRDLSPSVATAISIRRLGEVQIKTKTHTVCGFIRKIIVEPTFHLEISTGEKVEWEKILTITQGTTLCYES